MAVLPSTLVCSGPQYGGPGLPSPLGCCGAAGFCGRLAQSLSEAFYVREGISGGVLCVECCQPPRGTGQQST